MSTVITKGLVLKYAVWKQTVDSRFFSDAQTGKGACD